ncbi:MAG: alpha/beta hydrolase [Tepidisphaeraceae bacterium]|jgi:pimeloyl-ACP methyl ester carboxylesterase
MIRRILRGALLVYLGVTLTLFFLQTGLIFPGAATQGQRDATLFPSPRYELLTLPAHDGQKIAALFGTALEPDGQLLANAAARPTLIFFYGNAMCVAYSTDTFDHFRRLGFNVIIPDYEGYGMSTGKPSEAGCYAAADAAYDYLLTRKDIDSKKIVATGWSLGAGVAVDLAARRPVCGLAIFSPFTSMNAMAHKLVPWIPTSLILRHHFENLDKIRRISCPVLIANGTRDSIVPPTMADRLAAAAKSRVTRYRVDLADHNDLFEVGGDKLLAQLKSFVDGL